MRRSSRGVSIYIGTRLGMPAVVLELSRNNIWQTVSCSEVLNNTGTCYYHKHEQHASYRLLARGSRIGDFVAHVCCGIHPPHCKKTHPKVPHGVSPWTGTATNEQRSVTTAFWLRPRTTGHCHDTRYVGEERSLQRSHTFPSNGVACCRLHHA